MPLPRPGVDHGGMDSSHDQPSTSEPSTQPLPVRVLRRSAHHRILGGVAGGLAEYLGIDAAIVRVAFVVLALLGGGGIVLYLAGWLLIPAESGEVVAREWMDARPLHRNAVMVVLGIIVAVIAVSNLLAAGPWWSHWNHGIAFFLALFALSLAVVMLATSGTNRSTASRVRWVLVSALVSLLALVVLAAAVLFSVQALSGVPLRGGIGDTQVRPTAAAQVSRHYELAAGNLTVDLSEVTFAPGTTHISATVGIGRLVIEVPRDPSVSVAAHSGAGNVEVFDHDQSGFDTRTRTQSDAAGDRSRRVHLVVDAETGVGQVRVVRAG